MTKTRNIEFSMAPPEPYYVGDGFLVHHFIPSHFRLDMERMNPFIMLDYNAKMHIPPSRTPKGVGVHPHKGFETVTIAYKGKVEHHDSSGGGGIISEGDVQWMTAASGVLHKEYHEENWSKQGGDFQMVQLWVNLPAQDKKSAPKYQSIENKNIQRYYLKNDGGEVEVIAGNYNGVKGAASTFTPVHLYNVRMKPGARAEFEFPAHYNTALLMIEGKVTVNDKDMIPTNHFALFENEDGVFTLNADENALALILSGEPIKEPIAAHGPFVMNTRAELMQAFDEFQSGKFGYLE